jgi:hypothetical protein
MGAESSPSFLAGEARPDPTAVFLRAEGADRLHHGHGRTLLEHLLETRAVVRRWGAPPWVQEAAAVHSVYSTEVYRQRLLPLSRRGDLRAVVGARAERLAYLFGVVPAGRLFAALSRAASPDLSRATSQRGYECGDQSAIPGAIAPPSGPALAWLVVLHMANDAEQASDPGGGPGFWLITISQWAAKVSVLGVALPSVFRECSDRLTPDLERRARAEYRYGAAFLCDALGSSRHFERAIADCPFVGEPCILYALALLRRGMGPDAARWSTEGISRFARLGVCWDKRLRYEDWLRLGGLVARAARQGGRDVPPAADFASLRNYLIRAGALEGADGDD